MTRFRRWIQLWEARPLRTTAAIAGVLQLLLSLSGLNGYSMAMWHAWLDGDSARPAEVLIGRARSIRSDDAIAAIPYAVSQVVSRPAFPVHSRLTGYGETDMRAVAATLIADPISLFRPSFWGYLFGADFGIAWSWWFLVLGLFTSFFWLTFELTCGKAVVSLLSATAVLYAPFFQFWSLNNAAMGTYFAVAAAAAIRLIRTREARPRWGWAALLAWSLAAFGLAIYPPFQVPFLYLWIVLVLGVAFSEPCADRPLGRVARDVLPPLMLAGTLAILLVGGCLYPAREAFALLTGTVYPGQRVSVGGGGGWVRLFSNNFLPMLFNRDWPPAYGNICEAAAFVLVFPVVVSAILWRSVRERRLPDALTLAVLVGLFLGVVWWMWGIPLTLARLTGWSMVPTTRAPHWFGLLSIILLALRAAQKEEAPDRLMGRVLSVLWILFSIWLCIGGPDEPPVSRSLALKGSVAAVAIGLLAIRRPRLSLGLLAFTHLVLTIGFNPVAFSSMAYLRGHPVSRAVLEVSREQGAMARWISYSDIVAGNLFRMLGVPSASGVNFYPQFALWKVLDPGGRSRDAYNRYAHIDFEADPRPGTLSIASPFPDVVTIGIHPDHPRLRELGINGLVCGGVSLQVCESSREFTRVGEIHQGHAVYKRIRLQD